MYLFTWDEHKAAANLWKHRVDFDEAVTVFRDPLSVTMTDPEHSWPEPRFVTRLVTFGLSDRRRFLAVFHIDHPDGLTIHLISARPGTRSERWLYEEG